MSKRVSGKILVVDDDETIRDLCREVLTVAGYEVDTVRGADGLSILGSGYGLVIADAGMQEPGGLEFYASAVRVHPHLKGRFLFVTGDCSQLRPLVSKDLICLLKPFRISELLGTVDSMMTRLLEGLKGKEETGKRQEERFETFVECDVFDKEEDVGEFLAGRAVNLSRHGVRVLYEGAPLKMKEVSLFMSINRLSLHRRAEAVWSKRLGGGLCSSGLKLIEPVPASQLIILSRKRRFKKRQRSNHARKAQF